jgi:integrase
LFCQRSKIIVTGGQAAKHTILKAALREAVTQGLIATNPADKAKPPAAREAKAPEIRPWSAQQLASFLAWADDGCADAVTWRVLAYTGCRRGEALALRWRDLDARLSVRRSAGVVKTKGKGERVMEVPTKTGRQRTVDLDPQTIDALRSLRVARAAVSERLGHATATITMEIYQHVLPGMQSEAAARFAALVGGQP